MPKRIRKKKKRKLNILKLFIFLLVVAAIVFVLVKGVKFTKEKIVLNNYYLVSSTNIIPIYTYNSETEKMDKVDDEVYRGTVVKSGMVKKIIDEVEYTEIKIGEGTYGKSITDPCLGWEKTEKLIYDIADAIK